MPVSRRSVRNRTASTRKSQPHQGFILDHWEGQTLLQTGLSDQLFVVRNSYCFSVGLFGLISSTVSQCTMAEFEEALKKDYMMKRSQMKNRLKPENFRGRLFILSRSFLRYCEGSIEVSKITIFSLWFTIIHYDWDSLCVTVWRRIKFDKVINSNHVI